MHPAEPVLKPEILLVQIPQTRSPTFSSVFLCTCHSYGTGICYVDP